MTDYSLAAAAMATFPPYGRSLLAPTTYFGGKWRLFQNVSGGDENNGKAVPSERWVKPPNVAKQLGESDNMECSIIFSRLAFLFFPSVFLILFRSRIGELIGF
ncbi:hypothetical protein TNCV_585571 [Trichonephila clavipes]|nr:hypothetical protein TNCV_585571 [Trichonephila clavipes]